MKQKLIMLLVILIIITGSLLDLTILIYRLSVVFTGFLLIAMIVLLGYVTLLGIKEIKREYYKKVKKNSRGRRN